MTPPTRSWWQRPALRMEEEEGRHRRVGWLELFFDLVFVVVIAELGHALATDISAAGLAAYVALFVPVWCIWIGLTYYQERFETEGVENRIFMFLLMLPVAGLAVFAHHGLGDTFPGFALSYVAARGLILLLWLRAGRHVPAFRPVTARYAAGFTLAMLLATAAVLAAPPLRFMLWVGALVADVVTPVFTARHQAKLPRLSSSRMPERFGLFVIIVLGETIVGTVQGLAELDQLSLGSVTAGMLGMALGFGLWWIYFDFIGRRPFRPGVEWAMTWAYLHMPLVMSIAASGAGVLALIAGEHRAVHSNVRLLVAGGVAVALAAMGLLERTLRREASEPTHPWLSPGLKFGGAAVALALGTWGGASNPLAVLCGLMVLLLIQMVYGAYVWFRPQTADQSRAHAG